MLNKIRAPTKKIKRNEEEKQKNKVTEQQQCMEKLWLEWNSTTTQHLSNFHETYENEEQVTEKSIHDSR